MRTNVNYGQTDLGQRVQTFMEHYGMTVGQFMRHAGISTPSAHWLNVILNDDRIDRSKERDKVSSALDWEPTPGNRGGAWKTTAVGAIITLDAKQKLEAQAKKNGRSLPAELTALIETHCG